MNGGDDRPRVYGPPSQLALLFGSIAKLVEREPARTFSDTDVQHAGRRLAELIERRCGDDP
jgi:hypothetical protein